MAATSRTTDSVASSLVQTVESAVEPSSLSGLIMLDCGKVILGSSPQMPWNAVITRTTSGIRRFSQNFCPSSSMRCWSWRV